MVRRIHAEMGFALESQEGLLKKKHHYFDQLCEFIA